MKCPYCGKEILENDGFCPSCEAYIGNLVDKEGNPIENTESIKKTTIKKSNQQSTPLLYNEELCAYCGKPMRKDLNLCPHCNQAKSNTSQAISVKKVDSDSTKKTEDFNARYSAGDFIIHDNEKYFKFYLYLPIIMTIIIAVSCFVVGIILMSNDLVAVGLCACWLGGAVLCVFTYFGLKVALSYQILQIYYLRDIRKKLSKQQKKQGK